jgi:hypothetical protein
MGETLGNVISGYFRQTSTNLATGKKAGVPHGLKPRRPRRPLSNIYFILFHAFCFCWIISTHGEGDRITTTAAKGEGIQQYLRSTELRVLDVNWEPETRRRRCHLASLYSHRVLKRKSRLRPPLWNDYLFVTSVSRFSAHILLIIPATPQHPGTASNNVHKSSGSCDKRYRQNRPNSELNSRGLANYSHTLAAVPLTASFSVRRSHWKQHPHLYIYNHSIFEISTAFHHNYRIHAVSKFHHWNRISFLTNTTFLAVNHKVTKQGILKPDDAYRSGPGLPLCLFREDCG